MIAALAVLPAGLPAAVQATAAEPDPIFAVIAAHRAADAAMWAKLAISERMSNLADEKIGPSHIDIPSMVEPGATVQAGCWWDVERAIPRAQYPELNAHYDALVDERRAARKAFIGEPGTDEFTNEECEAAIDAREEFIQVEPTTLAGLLAKLIYANDLFEQEPDWLDWEHPQPFFAGVAQAAKKLIGGAA
ncbi:hypothetical protein JIR23_21155 [Bradyrhizobium diazoefficiens]|nr:hypothetical protein [Bradyrhizobium diazoefficiens]QQN62110.1 hypothetical protein JIR23_21155 [Bradyrhizobium diazoefficiens]